MAFDIIPKLSLVSDCQSSLSFDLPSVKAEALSSHLCCNLRGLRHCSKWTAEIVNALSHSKANDTVNNELSKLLNSDGGEKFMLAKSYFDLNEYDRSAHMLQNATNNTMYFLLMYSRYSSIQKKNLDNKTDLLGAKCVEDVDMLQELYKDLQIRHSDVKLDGYGLYLMGVVLRKLNRPDEARKLLVEAVNAEPLFWGPWMELAAVLPDKEAVILISYQHNLTCLIVDGAGAAGQLDEKLSECGFGKCSFLVANIATAQHNLREVDLAIETFNKLHTLDPFRLESMDTYSNLLYVKEMRAELAFLAHHCCNVDKYRVETCCVIGNFYSLRQQHDKSVLYFNRALKLNPNYLSALTLMGHEYMELKNTAAAIQAYRQAIEVNSKDHRAWYGLGQTYEILKMPSYSLYYYRQAQKLQPNDSRMLVALGETYEVLNRLQEAKKCFWKAHSVGDLEGLALIRLAKLYERLNEGDQASAAYTEYINETERQGTFSEEHSQSAYRFLATYYLNINQLDDAFTAAQKCTEFNQTREEAKNILREISRLRAHDRGVLGKPRDSMDPLHSSPTGRNGGSGHQGTPPLARLNPLNLTYTP